MAAKWIGFCVFMYIIGLFVGGFASGPVEAASNLTQVTTDVNYLMNPQLVETNESWGGLPVPTFNSEYFQAIGRAIVLDYPIFTGDPDSPWQLVRYLCLGPIAATVAFGLLMGAISLFQRLI